MNLYKGYVRMNGKEPAEKIEGVRNFRSLSEAKTFDSYGGVLSDETVMIDIDEDEQSEILAEIIEELQINCQIIRTSRGRHFTFRNNEIVKCYQHTKLACGLTADIKVGCGKSTVECLKKDGDERFVEWEYDESDDSKIPKWLLPVNSNVDFFGMKDGDGRDSALFSYILTLMSNGFSKEECRDTIAIINRWILADPMSEEDIERITRDDAFPDDLFFKGKTFLHNKFAEFLKNNNHIVRINGQLFVYRDGIYVSGSKFIEAAMIKYIPMIRATQRTEVLKYLEIICEEAKVADAQFIAFGNGILDLSKMQISPFSPDIVITNKIPWDYNSSAYSQLADETLNKIACNDADIRSVIEESIGYCFYRRNEMSKAFFLTGSGANGKSTFLSMIDDVIGDENKSSLSLEELDERFSVATLSNKLVNTGDDISDDFWQGKSTATFKKLVSGNEIKAEFKGQDAFFMKPYAKFFFSANALPRTKSKGFDAIKRRLVIIPFNAKFDKKNADYDPNIIYKLRSQEVMEYLIRIGIDGLKRVIANKDFTSSEVVEKELRDYELENNPMLLFIADFTLDRIVGRPCKEIYREYKIFCSENEFTQVSLSGFSKELSKRGIGVKRQRSGDGTLFGVYVEN